MASANQPSTSNAPGVYRHAGSQFPPPRKPKQRSKFTMTSRKDTEENTPRTFIFTMGNGEKGQLGLGSNYTEAKYPMWVKMDEEIAQIQAGAFHTACLTEKGEVLTFGSNDHGALGRTVDDDEYSAFFPKKVNLPEKAKQITCGECHTVALLESGKVYGWGDFKDSYGLMGLTVTGQQKFPVLMFSEDAIKIASGANHFALLTKAGIVHTTGCAEFGQLGRVSENLANRYTPKANERHLNLLPIKNRPDNAIYENIWAGSNATMAKVKGIKDIHVFGANHHRQLGVGHVERIYMPLYSSDFSQYVWQDIKTVHERSMGIDKYSRLLIVGRQEGGKLGMGSPVNSLPVLTPIYSLNTLGVYQIGVGIDSNFAATEEMGLLAWGTGTSGELGIGDLADKLVPFPLGSRALDNKKILQISGGARHTVILAYQINRPC